MKKFSIPCDFAGVRAPFDIYVGEPHPDKHPLRHQSSWLLRERGGNIPADVMASFEQLHNISKENGVSFEELCVYALGSQPDGGAANEAGGQADESAQA